MERPCQDFVQSSKLSLSSVQFSHSIMSDSLHPHEPQHARPPCSSPAPRVHPNPCPLSQWCHPTISSSVIPFSSHLQSFPASGPFPVSQVFASGGQSSGASASASVLPMIFRTDFLQDGLVGSPCSPRYSQESSLTPQFKSINSLPLRLLYYLLTCCLLIFPWAYTCPQFSVNTQFWNVGKQFLSSVSQTLPGLNTTQAIY